MSSTPWRSGADFTHGAEKPEPPFPHICVLLVGHGSRDEAANREFEALADVYRATRPGVEVTTAYVELAEPLLGDGLASAAARTPASGTLVVVPAFLFAAGHVKNDLPLAIDEARRRFPGTRIVAAPALGVHPELTGLAYLRAEHAIGGEPEAKARTALLVVGRGSSDPDANGDFCKVVRLVGEGRGLLHVEAAFMGITEPKVDAALDRLARAGAERVVVLPYLLFAGRLVEKLRAQLDAFRARHPWIRAALAPHLGVDAAVVRVLDERTRGALEGGRPLPCDTCQYRTALPGFASQVGGLRALLHSVRHTLTHSQVRMPVHLHRPLAKHVFVCVNADCAARGSAAVVDGFRREVKRAGRARSIRVTRTSCMGRCGEGPTVAVYPDGVFYRRVTHADTPELVAEHLLHDRLVSRLVDDVLQ